MEDYNLVQDEGSVSIDVRDVWAVFKHNIPAIVLITLVCALLGFGGARLMRTTSYEAKTTMIVNSPNGIDQPGTLAAVQAQSIKAVLQNKSMMQPAYSGLTKSAQKSALSVKIKADEEDTTSAYTHVLKLTLSGDNRASIKKGAQALSQTAKKVLPENLNTVESVKITKADIAEKHSPSTKKMMVLAAGLGFVLSVFYVLFRILRDTTYHSKRLLEEDTELPVLGTIPSLDSARRFDIKH
ncbi:YveK family protein [Pseudoramibacter sp. HA2172]|uniref:YveK family protein n=1 Tax=Pseudoramibacter faecis TaxID=3108534 RepID=UPI002E7A6A85|nr:Wzz/FepE/Etk N-terminal domain-containing protein [Pseudoramibacter sp. HA2172]